MAHNYDQNLALSNAVYGSASMAGVHEDWMERLEDQNLLDREIEFMPSTDAMEVRRTSHKGLTAPELATLMAYTKIVLEDEILASDLPDDPYLADRLINYFPTQMRERYAEQMPKHRLSREIVSTVVVNQFVNSSGITCFHRLSSETGAGAADVIRAQIAARAIFGADELDQAIRGLDHQIDAQAQTVLRMEVRTLIERATRWLINNRSRPIDIGAAVGQFADGVQTVQRALPTLLTGRDAEALAQRLKTYRSAGVPDELGTAVAALSPAYAALTIVQTADAGGPGSDQGRRGAFRAGAAAGPGPLAGPDHRAAAGRPLADHGSGGVARRPAFGARPADRPGADQPPGLERRRPGPGRQLGEGERRRARLGQAAAVDHRQPQRPGPDLGRPPGGPWSAAVEWAEVAIPRSTDDAPSELAAARIALNRRRRRSERNRDSGRRVM